MPQQSDIRDLTIKSDWRPAQFAFAYLLIIAAANLIWETAHAPLYTIWVDGTRAEVAFAIGHCTIGDVMIAGTSLAIAWVLAGRGGYPRSRYWRVAALSILIGVAYTIFSEWLNISVRQSWAYRDTMPTVGPLNTGLSPLLQWLIIPVLTFAWLRSAMRQ